ncbi:hypothetical protein A2V82_15305 [candidate division KSB1 bacterium RBG_16_48_16]|nr:MAG: hypothetical protein A2V82_15305 [candidate division KSB1 bacterium RBG_16_48_16]
MRILQFAINEDRLYGSGSSRLGFILFFVPRRLAQFMKNPASISQGEKFPFKRNYFPFKKRYY